MSNTETRPAETLGTAEHPPTAGVQVLRGREVPLGGPRALMVRRTLPHRDRSFVGAWCFVDHYGPTRVAGTTGMDVPPHPHTGLQTVSWLFEGVIEHRDSGGVHGLVRPGEVNLMTAGHGICHSEVSTPETDVLHGVQLWVALPDSDRNAVRAFDHHAAEEHDLPVDGGSATARVFVGELAGRSSPVRIFTPLLGAELTLAPDTTLTLTVDPSFEHAVLVDDGAVTFQHEDLTHADLGCLDAGLDRLTLSTGGEPARVVLLGGTPFEEEIVMWWNFVGRSHEEVVEYRDQWQEHADRFGEVEGYDGPVQHLPAPPLPGVRLRPRNRRGRT